MTLTGVATSAPSGLTCAPGGTQPGGKSTHLRRGQGAQGLEESGQGAQGFYGVRVGIYYRVRDTGLLVAGREQTLDKPRARQMGPAPSQGQVRGG